MLPEQASVGGGLTLGQYQVIDRIGSGGMATVYRGMQSSLNREVAIKVLPSNFADDPTFVERFKQEAVSVASLRHPNILSVFDFGEQNGIIYMVTEYLPGGTLADKLGKPMTLDEVLSMMGPLASAIDFAHSRGIIHRDLKPANVLLTQTGEPILSDFGLARLMEGSRLTRSGSALGTPEYMSPEQAMGGEIGPATDVYAFGVLLFEMFTGAVPFGGETPVAVILAQLHQPPPPPRSLEPNIPEEIEAIILKCLAKNPNDRYPNARAVIADLEATRQPSHGAPYPTAPLSSTSGISTANVVMTPSPSNETVWQKVTMDFLGDKLLWNGQGRERARELIKERLAELNQQGWELVGSILDPGILQKGQSLRGDTVRGAVFHVKPIRK